MASAMTTLEGRLVIRFWPDRGAGSGAVKEEGTAGYAGIGGSLKATTRSLKREEGDFSVLQYCVLHVRR